MDAIFLLTFIFASVTVIYAYFGYPLLLLLWGLLKRKRIAKQPITPSISVIIAAYNEEETIAGKIENLLASDYPLEKMEIIVASDGSTDRTNEIASAYSQVRLLALPRRGKMYALHDAIQVSRGDLLIFTDADVRFTPESVPKLLQSFHDPSVGGVAGNKISRLLENAESAAEGERWYGQYDQWLKYLETLSGSVTSGDGSIYGIRRDLYKRIEDPSVTDDFAISTGVIVARKRLVFEKEAPAYEEPVPTTRQEFGRKTRLMSRGFRSLFYRRELFNPFRHGFYSIALFSHKLLRRLVPILLLLLFLSNGALLGASLFFQLTFLFQLSFYSAAILGYFLRRTSLGGTKLLLAPFYFCLGNLAALIAFARFVTGYEIKSWEPQRNRPNQKRS